MNFNSFTPQQEQSVRHLDGPLFIAAGAGSGKTFTLQQRIAYALLPESGPALSSVDEVLAITFMEKAAAEIKARVRSALRAEGMAEEALKVDSAWISTIHGMCSRILREHALVAGIDPAFTVLSEFDARKLRQRAIDEVLHEARVKGEHAALFAEYGVVSSGFNAVSVSSILESILSKTASFAQGLDAIDLGAQAPSPGAVARQVLVSYENALRYGEIAASAKKATPTLEKTIASCEDACHTLNGFFERGANGYRDLADVLIGLPRLTKTSLGRNDEAASEVALEVARTLDWALRNLNAALARPYAEELLTLARRVEAVYQRSMDERAVLDNNGLLHRTLHLLEAHGEIASSYQRRFKLVMVDEFQDTNQLQVDLIKLVAGDARLCTVGDAQQSIYRFNGADVAVFEQQRESVRARGVSGLSALETNLDRNFRSHKDVLSFVRRVCSQQRVFGEGFLDLEPARVPQEGRYFGAGPRIEVQLVSYRGSKGDSGALQVEASRIAERFAALREAGHKPSEMVVLLGKMTSADVYAEELRKQGFECVFSGGRSFFQMEEVRTVRYVLTALANPHDTKALFSALSSPMLHLSADDFLVLSTCVDETGSLRRRDIASGLFSLGLKGEEPFSEALSFAVDLFMRAYREIKQLPPSQVLMHLVVDSGWLARLEGEGAEGSAVAANILKAIRMVEDLERKPGYGLSRVSRDFRAMAESDSSGPASLSVSGQNSVRIMTIHKSKGLEYPIVAVASYEPWGSSSDSFSMTACEGKVFTAFSLKNTKAKVAKGLAASWEPGALEMPGRAEDAASFAAAVRSFDWEEEVREAQRKFYVACTRASEYLLISGVSKCVDGAADGGDALDGAEVAEVAARYGSTPILDDVRAALMGECVDFPE
ncbi:MAG: UvrD-helicase domain-containing protein, partial [Eggerthellaceae bacterium]|nr:UvrD-helicase domain-containing protein [Eggerthellaceae bacterium]